MSEFKIVKNAPPRQRRSRYHFEVLAIGDAIDAPIVHRDRIATAAINWGKKNGVKFSVYKIDENTVRCRRMS